MKKKRKYNFYKYAVSVEKEIELAPIEVSDIQKKQYKIILNKLNETSKNIFNVYENYENEMLVWLSEKLKRENRRIIDLSDTELDFYILMFLSRLKN